MASYKTSESCWSQSLVTGDNEKKGSTEESIEINVREDEQVPERKKERDRQRESEVCNL